MLEIAFTTCAKSLPLGAVPLVFRRQCRRDAPPLERAGNNFTKTGLPVRVFGTLRWIKPARSFGRIGPRDQKPLVVEPLNGTSDSQARRSGSSQSRPI